MMIISTKGNCRIRARREHPFDKLRAPELGRGMQTAVAMKAPAARKQGVKGCLV
jgi:hypothetical protein